MMNQRKCYLSIHINLSLSPSLSLSLSIYIYINTYTRRPPCRTHGCGKAFEVKYQDS